MEPTSRKTFFTGSFFLYLAVVVAIAVISFFVGRATKTSSVTAGGQQAALPQPQAHKTINKSFSFPIKDQNNKVVANMTYTLQSADKTNEIIIKGQPATAIQGKTFLVVNLRLDNPSNQSIMVNTRDYIRLTINNNNEMLAPEVYNDPVEIQAISTKLTRVGFPINTTDKNLVLHVGEINGTKTDIPLSF